MLQLTLGNRQLVTTKRANAITTHAEAAAEVLNIADASVREQIRRNNGDSAANALYSSLLDQTADNTGERSLLVKGWNTMSSTVQLAGKGEFDHAFDAAAYSAQVLSEFTSEQHRNDHLLAKLDYYTNPAGKLVLTYVRDRNAGQLVEYSVPVLPQNQQVQLEASKAAALQSLQQQLSRMEGIRSNAASQAVPMPVRPDSVRPADATLNQLGNQAAQARTDLQQFGRLHFTIDDIRELVNSRVTPANQVPAPTEAQLQEAPPYTPQQQQQFMEQTELLVQQLDVVLGAQLGCINAETDWLRYAAEFDAFTQAENNIRNADDRIYELEQRRRQLMTPEPTAVQQATALKPSTVQGYHHSELGFVMTPSLLVYYTLRATYEAVYQLAGTLDAESYRRLKQSKGQDLRSWGSKVQAMAASFPKMRDDEHRGIYQEGIIDSALKARIKKHRADNPKTGNTLESLIRLAQELADREVEMLSEIVDSAQTSIGEKTNANKRIGEMLVLMGNVPPGLNPKATAAGNDDAAADGGQLKSRYSDFRNAAAYRSYCRSTCILHPKAGHSNEACYKQKAKLGPLQQQFNAGAPMALTAHALQAVPTVEPPPARYAAPAWEQPGSMYSHPGWPPFPPWGYPGASVYPPSTAPPSELGMAAGGTLKDQRQQALKPPPGNRGGRPLNVNVGNLPLPPPVQGTDPCTICGMRYNHAPYPCGFKYPHLAGPRFFPPTPNTSPELQRMYQENVRKMPPGMPLGGCLPDYLDRYREALGPQHCERMARDITDMSAKPRVPRMQEFANMACTLGMHPLAYLEEQSNLGYQPALFPNTCSSSANTYCPTETAAAYPRSFLQVPATTVLPPTALPATGQLPAVPPALVTVPLPNVPPTQVTTSLPPTAPPATGQLPAVPPALVTVPLPTVPPVPATVLPPLNAQPTAPPQAATSRLSPTHPDRQLAAGRARELVQELDELLAGLQDPVAEPPAGSAANSSSSSYNIAGYSTETPVLAGRKLRWSDELDRVHIRNSSNANYQAQLVKQLQQLRDTHSPIGINMKIRQNRRFVLDRFINEDMEHGCSYLLPNGETVMGNFASDSGATFSLVNKNWCHRVSLNYSLTDIKLKLADTSMGRVIGITDPVWCIIAKGTPNEALGMAQALVMEDCPEDLDGLMAKDVLHTMDAWVDQRSQQFCYRSTAGHRCSVPVECFVEYSPTIAALMHHDGAAATEDSGDVHSVTASNEAFTAYACAGLSDFNLAATINATAANHTATPITTNGQCKGHTDSLPADSTNTGGGGGGYGRQRASGDGTSYTRSSSLPSCLSWYH